ncbi:VP1 [Solenopsis invicta densovirus]|uniref:VP1 n=1 Tax=Solenopsis invicta densovirus TaxID=1414671 RepID=U5TU71_9VIRU|nr:VP1 [Solenopsis invicta densovirus]AGZ03695.1 VP1 [Solenopsis invicta densovirus]
MNQPGSAISRVERSGRGSGRGLNKIVDRIFSSGTGVRRRNRPNVRYTPIGTQLNQVNRVAVNKSTPTTRSQWSKTFNTTPKGIDPVITGGTGAAVGALLGGGIEALTNKRLGGVTLPGSDYIGPGNKIGIDAPRSAADQIGKFHDITYAELLEAARRGVITKKEFLYGINHTDKKHADLFDKEWKESGSWQAFIGKYGLNFKNYIEEKTGVLYPSYPNRKYFFRWFGKI